MSPKGGVETTESKPVVWTELIGRAACTIADAQVKNKMEVNENRVLVML